MQHNQNNIVFWNQIKGALDANGEQSSKLKEIKNYIKENKIYVMAMIQNDWHGPKSRQKRKKKCSTAKLKENMHI